uniref:EB domain-containing protein n=1 Tax=Heterorhabditis bacteriophora TaxID=37862 RepID=A0A1I7XVK6_HETBA
MRRKYTPVLENSVEMGKSALEEVIVEATGCHSGQCRCQPGFIALSGNCVSLPMPTTPQMKTIVFAKPLESCDNGEQCEGGASCDRTTGICMCPPGQVVFGIQCQVPPTNKERTTRSTSSFSISKALKRIITYRKHTQIIKVSTLATTECVDDRNCNDGKICVVSRCKCRPGYVDNAGQCEPLEEIELGERPVPISYAKHKVETMFSERIQPTKTPGQSEGTTKFISSSQTPPPHVSQRPRIVGSPIRRPKQKSKLIGNSGSGNYKTGSGSGTCPPGNDPTRDDSGKLIMCNGLEPNCPPRSYCYITSGGFATEEYNCCKSW